MTPVWDVAPHPDATQRESPGNFREHGIEPFSADMVPPAWPLVPARLEEWIGQVCLRGKGAGEDDDGQPLPERPARMVPLAALVDEEFSLPALRQAAQRGRLEAFQGPDGIWRSSRKSVNAYRKSRHQRRPGQA